MDFKPSDFYVGVIDFFAILLPGSIGVLIVDQVFEVPIEEWSLIDSDLGQFLIFLLFAYLFGHVISQTSAYIDTKVYNVRDKDEEVKGKYGQGKELVRQVREKEAINQAVAKHIDEQGWARAYLLKNLPKGYAEIERYTADAKFFRSLVVIMPILALVLIWQSASGSEAALTYWGLAVGSVGIAVFAWLRYWRKMIKADMAAFNYFIFLEHSKLSEASSKKDKRGA